MSNGNNLAEDLTAYKHATGKSWDRIAGELDYSTGTLKRYIDNGPFQGCERFETRAREYLVRRRALLKDAGKKAFYSSKVYQILTAALKRADSEREIALVAGPAGVGKTVSIQRSLKTSRAEDEPVYLCAHVGIQKKGLVLKLAEALGRGGAGTFAVWLDLLSVEMAANPRLVVVDEANYLNADCMDALRYIWDQSGQAFGLALIGTTALIKNIRARGARGGRAELEQFNSRVGFQIVLPGFDDHLVDQAIRDEFGDSIGKELAEKIKKNIGSKHTISMRRLEKIIKNVRYVLASNPGTKLDENTIDAAVLALAD